MSIFFQLCKKDGDVEGNPEIKLTDYIISEINWLTSSFEHDLEWALHKDFEYIIEIKGKILPDETITEGGEVLPNANLINPKYKEEQDAKELIMWALAPGNSEEAYKRITIEVYVGGEVETIKDIDKEKRSKIRNDSMREAYVVNYLECFPENGSNGQFVIQFREKIKDETRLLEIQPKSSKVPKTPKPEDEYKAVDPLVGQKRFVNVNENEHLNLQSSNGIYNTNILAEIPKGAELELLSGKEKDLNDNEWIKVKYGDKIGWVSCDSLTEELNDNNAKELPKDKEVPKDFGNDISTDEFIQRTVWDFFITKGFSKEQTAGIMGNMMQESGWNPLRRGGGQYWGLAQINKSLAIELEKKYQEAGLYMSIYGYNIKTYQGSGKHNNIPRKDLQIILNVQLEYIYGVRPTGLDWVSALKSAKNVNEATEIYLVRFEGATEKKALIPANKILFYSDFKGKYYQDTEKRRTYALLCYDLFTK